MTDFSKLKIPIKAYDNCTVIDVSSGAFPRYIEVRMPGKDGARRTAVWDGSLNLANNDKVMCHEYPGNPILRIVGFGGNQAAGTDGVKVSKIWEPDGSATTLTADNSGDNTISGHVIMSGASKTIKGTGSNVPDLGTSTAAERFGNLYLADTKTIDNPGTLNINATTAQVFKIATAEKMRLVSGGLGIGTATVPHGAVGAAILALDGPDSSTSGPHIQTTTASDDYPLAQILSWTHDNIQILLDAYYPGGANYLSSDAGSNFRLFKNTDALTVEMDTGIAQGGVITWDQTLKIDATGVVINEGGLDRDLRIEGVGEANLFVLDAGQPGIAIGTATFLAGTFGAARLQIDRAANATILLHRETADAGAPTVEFLKRRSGWGVVSDGDRLGTIGFSGADGTDAASAAQIYVEADGGTGNNDMPGRIILATSPDGSATVAERVRVDNAGNVSIGGFAPTLGLLHIKGTGNTTLAIQSPDANDAELRIRRTTSDYGWSIYKPASTLDLRFFESNASGGDRVTFQAGGNVGIGNTSPRGKFDTYDSTGLSVQTKILTAIDGTPQTVVANGTGDASRGCAFLYVCYDNNGNDDAGWGQLTQDASPGSTFAISTVALNTITLTLAADGSITVARTAGTRTFTLLLWLLFG